MSRDQGKVEGRFVNRGVEARLPNPAMKLPRAVEDGLTGRLPLIREEMVSEEMASNLYL